MDGIADAVAQAVDQGVGQALFVQHLPGDAVQVRDPGPFLHRVLGGELGPVHQLVDLGHLRGDGAHEHGAAHVGHQAVDGAAPVQHDGVAFLDGAVIAAVVGITGIGAGGHDDVQRGAAGLGHDVHHQVPHLGLGHAGADQAADRLEHGIGHRRALAHILQLLVALADAHLLQQGPAVDQPHAAVFGDVQQVAHLARGVDGDGLAVQAVLGKGGVHRLVHALVVVPAEDGQLAFRALVHLAGVDVVAHVKAASVRQHEQALHPLAQHQIQPGEKQQLLGRGDEHGVQLAFLQQGGQPLDIVFAHVVSSLARRFFLSFFIFYLPRPIPAHAARAEGERKNILTSACRFVIITLACGGCGEAAERTGLWLRHSRVQISSPTPPLLGAAGVSPSGKARDFDSLIRRSDSCHPSQYEPLAQPVEHLTFNQGVRSSNLRWLTNLNPTKSPA